MTPIIPGSAQAIAPSDATELGNCIGVYVGGTGDLTVVDVKGNTVTYKAVPVGAVIWLRINKVKATGTTATLLVGHFQVH